jgi:hypothetical protein
MSEQVTRAVRAARLPVLVVAVLFLAALVIAGLGAGAHHDEYGAAETSAPVWSDPASDPAAAAAAVALGDRSTDDLGMALGCGLVALCAVVLLARLITTPRPSNGNPAIRLLGRAGPIPAAVAPTAPVLPRIAVLRI